MAGLCGQNRAARDAIHVTPDPTPTLYEELLLLLLLLLLWQAH